MNKSPISEAFVVLYSSASKGRKEGITETLQIGRRFARKDRNKDKIRKRQRT